MHRRPLIASAVRFLTACVLAIILSCAAAAAALTPCVKTASWGSDESASGRFGDAPTAERESIKGGEAWSYESALGRTAWLSRDPIGEKGGLNLYGYVGNQPASLVDADGRCPLAIPVIAGFTLGEVLGAAAVSVAAPIFLNAAIDAWNRSGSGSQSEPTSGSPTMNSSLPPGYWPADRGASEWGRRSGEGAQEGRRRFHGIKQKCPESKATHPYGVNPDTGDVIDPEGENAGNLNEAPPK